MHPPPQEALINRPCHGFRRHFDEEANALMLSCCSSTNALNCFFFNAIQNTHVHEPSKLAENLQHLHITTEQNLNSNRCPKKPRIQCFEIHCRNILLT